MKKYEYLLLTHDFTAPKFHEASQRELDEAGAQGWYVIQCTAMSKFMVWTLCRTLP